MADKRPDVPAYPSPGGSADLPNDPSLEPVLDRAVLDAVAGLLAPAALAPHIDRLIERGGALLERLRSPTATEHDGDLADRAHALGGAAGMLGFARLAAAAWAFEAAVLRASPDACQPRAALGVALDQALTLLRRERARLRP